MSCGSGQGPVEKEGRMILLTDEQRRELDGNEAFLVRDPQTNEMYVLVRAGLYERLRALLDDGTLTDDERRAIVKGVWERAGWDDPAMEDYAAPEPLTKT